MDTTPESSRLSPSLPGASRSIRRSGASTTCAGYTDSPEAKTSMAATDARRRVGRPRPKYSPGDPHAWLTLASDLRRQPRASWSSSHLNTYGWVLSKVREIRSTLRHTLPA